MRRKSCSTEFTMCSRDKKKKLRYFGAPREIRKISRGAVWHGGLLTWRRKRNCQLKQLQGDFRTMSSRFLPFFFSTRVCLNKINSTPIRHIQLSKWETLTFWIQHPRDVQVLLCDVKSCVQIFKWIILQSQVYSFQEAERLNALVKKKTEKDTLHQALNKVGLGRKTVLHMCSGTSCALMSRKMRWPARLSQRTTIVPFVTFWKETTTWDQTSLHVCWGKFFHATILKVVLFLLFLGITNQTGPEQLYISDVAWRDRQNALTAAYFFSEDTYASRHAHTFPNLSYSISSGRCLCINAQKAKPSLKL